MVREQGGEQGGGNREESRGEGTGSRAVVREQGGEQGGGNREQSREESRE